MDKPVTVLLLLKRVDCNDGVASYLETLVKGLNERGDRVVIVSGPVTELYGSETRRREIRGAVVDWVVIDGLKPSRPSFAVLGQIRKIIREHRVDVISPQGFSVLPLSFLLAKSHRLPVVSNYLPSMVGAEASTMATSLSLTQKLAFSLIANLFRPTAFIAISRDIHEFFRSDCHIAARKIVDIPLGVDSVYVFPTDAERTLARRNMNIADEILVCVLPGRLNFVKGHDVAINAIRKLRLLNPELKIACLFPGAGDQAEQIRAHAFIDDKDYESFRFLGFVRD